MTLHPTRPTQAVESIRVASSVFLIYEICITLDQEFEFIWTRSSTVTCWSKWQYFFTRYFALAASLANRFIELFAAMHTEPLPPPLRSWFVCQVILGAALLLSVEWTLMARVYALYNRLLYVACIFGTLFICEIISAVVGVVLNMSGANDDARNVGVSKPNSFIYFGITAIISQVVILALIVFKFKSTRNVGWSTFPIAALVIRDGTISSAIILLVTIWTLLSAMTDKYSAMSNSWFLSIVSCVGCRLVINLHQFIASSLISEFGHGQGISSVQFTTFAGSSGGNFSLDLC